MNNGCDNKKLSFGIILDDGTFEELQSLGEIQEIAAESLEPIVEEETTTLLDKAETTHTFTFESSSALFEIMLKSSYKYALQYLQTVGKERGLDKRYLKCCRRRLRLAYNKSLKSIKK